MMTTSQIKQVHPYIFGMLVVAIDERWEFGGAFEVKSFG